MHLTTDYVQLTSFLSLPCEDHEETLTLQLHVKLTEPQPGHQSSDLPVFVVAILDERYRNFLSELLRRVVDFLEPLVGPILGGAVQQYVELHSGHSIVWVEILGTTPESHPS